jgi:CRISPR-associated endonuclease Csn1
MSVLPILEPKVGFKNSQNPRCYNHKICQRLFKIVLGGLESVKGGMVAEFRKAWGYKKSYTKDGKKYYEKTVVKHS